MSAQDRIRSIRLSLRFIAPLVVTLALLAYALVPLVDRLTLRWWVSDLDIRSQLIANTMEEQLADLVEQGARGARSTHCSRGRCRTSACTRSPSATSRASCATRPRPIRRRSAASRRWGATRSARSCACARDRCTSCERPVYQGSDRIGSLILVARHELRRAAQRRYAPLPDRPVRRPGRGHFAGHGVHRPPVLARLGRGRARAAARRGHRAARSRSRPRTICIRWPAICARCCATSTCPGAARTAARSGARKCCAGCCAKSCLATRSSSSPTASRSCTCTPTRASSCSGRRAAWSPRSNRSCAPAPAPGSRTAAAAPTARRSTAHDRLRVPPEKPSYTLRRVWLTPEEEQGYYYGFANEGLWPLCHIAHVRPVFRTPDWAQYVRGEPALRRRGPAPRRAPTIRWC